MPDLKAHPDVETLTDSPDVLTHFRDVGDGYSANRLAVVNLPVRCVCGNGGINEGFRITI